MAGVPFYCLLQQFHRESELLVEIADPRGKPRDEPIPRRQEKRFLETIISSLLFACEQDIGASKPNVSSIPAFFDGGVRKSKRTLQIATAAESHGFGRKQFRLVRKSFEGLVGPKPGFAKFAEFDQHADLAGPRSGVLGIELEYLRIETKCRFEIPVFKSGARFSHVVGTVLDQSGG